MKNMRVIDFFCGAGGFSEGFRQQGFEIIMGIDNWRPAIDTHNLNHGLNDETRSVLDFEDINNIESLPDSEIIVGSPPCVSFSLSNKGGNADKTLGIRLIEAYLRVVAVKKHQPNSILKAWLMENVPNSKNYVKEVYTFADLNLSEWASGNGIEPSSIALNVKENGAVLKASDYGAAQARNRFVCGEMTDKNTFPMPQKADRHVSLADIKTALPPPLEQSKGKDIQDPNYPSLHLTGESLTDHHYDTGVYEIEWRRAKAAKQNHPYMGRMSFPEDESKPSRTIMATRSASTREALLYKSELDRKGNGEYRMPTIREAASIMGFPITYVFTGNEATKWRQVGNAVCPQLAASLAKQIKVELGVKPNHVLSFNMPSKVDLVTLLDDYCVKTFDRPPKRNSKALFRHHAVKSGNMTVALTNKNPLNNTSEWSVVAFMGTGKTYRAVQISRDHRHAAGKVLKDLHPEFIDTILGDESISYIAPEKLEKLNGEYHYDDKAGEHPLSLINKIADHIDHALHPSGDYVVMTKKSILSTLKSQLPVSQLMAIYATGTIVHPVSPADTPRATESDAYIVQPIV